MVAESVASRIANLRATPAAERQQAFEAYVAIKTTNDVTIEWLRCKARFAYFLRYVKIRDVHKGLIKFQLWDYLVEIADDWQTGQSFVEGKARQLGYSTLLAGYDVWVGTFRDHARILSFSINQRASDALIQKVRETNEDLPDWLRREFVKKGDTKSHLRWEGTLAEMEALPSTGTAGRGSTATIVQTDEWAFHENAQEHYSAYRSAIADGGQHIAVSTGNGSYNMFHRYFTSTSSDIPYIKRFNGWRSRPDRDDAWYRRERDAFMVSALDPESDEFGKHPGLFKRENPESIEEMFEVFIGLVYDCFSDLLHVKAEDPFKWREADLRVAGIDPGQGDPFAMGVFGEKDGHAHQFAEFYKLGVVSEDIAVQWLMAWHRQAPLNGIFCDGNEGTLIATINERFRKAFGMTEPICHAANKERRTGIGHVYGRIFSGTLTIARRCPRHIQEYHEYQWTKVRKGQQEWATSTPSGHHGDGMDESRYALVGLAKGFQHAPIDPSKIQPRWDRMEHPRTLVVDVPGQPGKVRDAGMKPKRPHVRQPNFRQPRTFTPGRGVPSPSRGFGRMGLRG